MGWDVAEPGLDLELLPDLEDKTARTALVTTRDRFRGKKRGRVPRSRKGRLIVPDPGYWTAWASSVAVEVFRLRLHHEVAPGDFAADGELVEKARNRLSTTRLSQIVLRNTAALCPETACPAAPSSGWV